MREIFYPVLKRFGIEIYSDTTFIYKISVKKEVVRGHIKRQGYELKYCFDLKKSGLERNLESPN